MKLEGDRLNVALTEAQTGLWLARRLDPDNPIQNTGQILRLRGTLNVPVFAAVVEGAFVEADGLRARVSDTQEGPRLLLGDLPLLHLDVVDVSDQGDPYACARDRIHADMARPRDPFSDDPVTTVLYRLGPEDYLWYLCIQHLVVDGYGTTLLNTRILDLYRASILDEAPATRPFVSFVEVAKEDQVYRSAPRRDEDRYFWKKALDDLPEVRSLSAGVPLSSSSAHYKRSLLPPSVMEGMLEIAKSSKVGWPDVAVALVSEYLHRHIGGEEIVVGVPAMNRLRSAAARVPAMIMNVLPIRFRPGESDTPSDLASRVGDTLRQARKHGRYRSEELRRELGLIGGEKRLHGPLINILPFQALPSLPGIDLELEILGAGPVDDLTITLRGGAHGEMYLEVEANPRLYRVEDVPRHLLRLSHFLECAVTSSHLSSVPTLTPAEEEHWLYTVNATTHPVAEGTLVDRIEAQIAATPDAPALEGDGECLDYRAFGRRTGVVAQALREVGAGPGKIVAILLPRSVQQVVAFVGTLRAGAAYLPVDPEYPPARIAALLEMAQPAVVICSPELRDRLPLDAPVLESWESQGGFLSQEGEATGSQATPDDPAYLIFTSGSTGAPKGVLVEHRAIVNRLDWMQVAFELGPGERFLQKTPATFDVSVWEFFLPFLVGGTLVVAPPRAHADPAALAALLREKSVTAVHFVPSMLAAFLDHPDSKRMVIPRVFSSGEALPAALRDRFHATVKGELHNLYGPTEAAVDVTHWPATPEDTSDPVPIGRPVWNTQMYVLDRAMRPVPPGVEGELYIAGRQLARGYVGRPDLTTERFIPDPFGAPGDRMYRTGDLAHWREDGALVFIGRADHQVKVRGQRIELGEIEAALRSFSEVADAAVLLREDRPGDPSLAAYIVPASGDTNLDAETVRSRLSRILPEVMIPPDVVMLTALPLTASGKLDRRALPAPTLRVAPEGPVASSPKERLVARLFQNLLGLSGLPGINGDFFALGGHSLLAIQLGVALREEVGVEPGPASLFSYPTVGHLAAYLDRLESERDQGHEGAGDSLGLGPVVRLSPAGESSGTPPLYCIHPAGGISWCYASLARALSPSRPVFGIQAEGLDLSKDLPETLEEMAEGYVAQILKNHPGGPLHLVGWSMGGIIAQAMAVRLQEEGHPVGVVALLDAYPADRWRDEADPGEGEALRALLLIAGEDPDAMGGVRWTRDGVRERLRRGKHPLGQLPDEALDGVVRVVDSNSRLVRRHHHRFFSGTLLHFRAGWDHEGEGLEGKLWSQYAARVESFEVPAKHPQMTSSPIAARIATILAPHLEPIGTQ